MVHLLFRLRRNRQLAMTDRGGHATVVPRGLPSVVTARPKAAAVSSSQSATKGQRAASLCGLKNPK